MNRILRKRLPLVAIVLVAILISKAATTQVFGAGGSKGPPEDLKERARPVFEIEGVVYTDAKEDGFLEVGVENMGLAIAVEQKLANLGIPLSSVKIVESKPIIFVTTIRDKVRPLEGGLQITFVDGPFAYLCTLGLNAVRNGVNGFLVNSHCTTDQFKEDGTEHYQNSLSPSSNLSGNEIADPPSFRCAPGKKCRYSDAAYDQLAVGVDATLGSIARPSGINNGSLTIAGSFNITGEAMGNAAVGTLLNKVGRTTGWTQGRVTNSCVDTGVSGTNFLLLCQDFVEAEVGGGDSGSPVFEINSGDDVTLYGILWGGSSDGSYFVYSPIGNVESELGDLTTIGQAGPGNTAPTADDKVVTTDEDVPVNIILQAADPEECELTISIVDGLTNGTLSAIADNGCTVGSPNSDSAAVTFSPNADFNGNDSFTYKANDGISDSNIATVSITVNPVNDAPVANDVTDTTPKNTQGTWSPDVSDIDSVSLTCTVDANSQNGGAVMVASDCSSGTFDPAADFTGNDTFSYMVSDETLTDTASVTYEVIEPSPNVTVESITPNSMIAGTTIDITITGTGFTAGAELTFINGGGPAPTASNVVVNANTNSITAEVTAKSGGPPRDRVWDLRVTNPDGLAGVLEGGFTVKP